MTARRDEQILYTMIYSLDIETSGLDRFKDEILLIGLYNPIAGYHSFKTAKDLFSFIAPDMQFIMHNGSFDVNFLRHHGADLREQWAYDTRSIASIMIPQPPIVDGQKTALGLENLYRYYLKGQAYKLDRENMSSYSKEELKAYNQKDCEITFGLFEKFLSSMPEKNWEFVESWIMPATKLCADLEFNGIYGDWKGLEAYKSTLEELKGNALNELNEITKEARGYWKELQTKEIKKGYNQLLIKALEKSPKDPAKTRARYDLLLNKALVQVPDFNWSSPKQLTWLFKDYLALDLRNKRTDKETTNEEKLKELDHPIAKKLLDYREVEKLLTQQIPALLDNVKADECVHGRITVGGTRTGRLSSSQPNLQQISARKPLGKKIRSFIQAKPGNLLLTVDYSQIEPRLIAHASGEEKLIKAFEDKIDIYSVFASEIFGITNCDLKDFKSLYPVERACGKTGGLSVLYGTGPSKFAEMVRKETGKSLSAAKAKELIERFRSNLPKVQKLKDTLERKLANKQTYYNLLGRPFYIESNEDLYMKSLNTFIQGSASDLVVDSQSAVVEPTLKLNKFWYKYRLLVHDEVVIELRAEDAEIIAKSHIIPAMTQRMQQRLALTVPLDVSYTISSSWEKS